MEKISTQEAKWRRDYYKHSHDAKTRRVRKTPFSYEVREMFWETVLAVEEGLLEPNPDETVPYFRYKCGAARPMTLYQVTRLENANEQVEKGIAVIIDDVDMLVEGKGCGSVRYTPDTIKQDHARCGMHFVPCPRIFVKYGDLAIRTSGGCTTYINKFAHGTAVPRNCRNSHDCLLTAFGEIASDFESPKNEVRLDEYW